MTIKILIKRNFKEGTIKEASTMLIKSRSNAIEQKGYISSETLVSYDDPNTILVQAMWQTKEDWDNYKKSQARKNNERLYAKILNGVTEYQVFKMGM